MIAPANADTLLFDNTGEQTSGFADGIDLNSGAGPLYDSFTTDAAVGEISGLQLYLQLGGPATGSFEVELYADSSNNPGAFLANLGAVSDSLLSGSLALTPVLLNESLPALSANTIYWIGLCDGSAASCVDSNGVQDSTMSNAQWSFAAAAGGDGYDFSSSFPEYVSNQAGIFPDSDSDTPYQVSLTEAAITTPEPGSSCMTLSAVVALMALRRYLQNRSAMSGV